MAMADTERVAARARALREAAGTITGHASEAGGEGARDMLTDVLSVFGSDAGLQWGDLAARLASRFPARRPWSRCWQLPPPTGSAPVDNRRSCRSRYRADRQPGDALQYAAA
jgi:hypothetical protein